MAISQLPFTRFLSHLPEWVSKGWPKISSSNPDFAQKTCMGITIPWTLTGTDAATFVESARLPLAVIISQSARIHPIFHSLVTSLLISQITGPQLMWHGDLVHRYSSKNSWSCPGILQHFVTDEMIQAAEGREVSDSDNLWCSQGCGSNLLDFLNAVCYMLWKQSKGHFAGCSLLDGWNSIYDLAAFKDSILSSVQGWCFHA